ncbi:MAG: tRNA (adenosine(37)-N6)-threonylcarbamoyltransferase complex dimerization subunit type 1 TsaB [Candidatus Hydrogenedens sp.]|nr:tRNA (adenosine(37)-N6)-threonylcarbamoyltransferase complex dimerization subunit type 1 TsaB [Candidatus Hydrogenedens sp.]
MQYLLAADTATSLCSVAVCTRDPETPVPPQILSEVHFEAGRRHAESLLDAMDAALSHAAIALEEIDLLAIATGPGSFTGLRIGVATWKGLAFAQRLPLVGVPTLDAMSRLVPWTEGALIVPMLDARMSEVFGAAYRIEDGARVEQQAACVLPPQEFLAQLSGAPLCIGDGAWLYREQIAAALPQAVMALPPGAAPRASALAWEAFSRYDGGATTDPGLANPVYLRKSQAEVNRENAAKAHDA